MSLLSRGPTFLRTRLAGSAGVSVTYTRPAESLSATLTAVVGTPAAQVVLPGEVPGRVETTERDYLVAAADLPFGPPKRGDRITEAGVGTFEARQLSSEPVWRWSDAARTVYRVHTKQV